MNYKKDTLDFFQQVYQVVRLIPKGRITTYGAIAKSLGSGKSSRIVGWAMNNSHAAKPKVPAHRVVNRIGMLTGKHHFRTEGEMKRLLEAEKVKVENDRVIEFKKLFWDPLKEIKIG